jgi:hypothetical protein
MEFLEIDCDMLDGLDKKGRDAFNRIMDDAKLKYGFEVSGKRIFVQLFPSKDGGCEMFISRLYDKKRSKPSLAVYISSIASFITLCESGISSVSSVIRGTCGSEIFWKCARSMS